MNEIKTVCNSERKQRLAYAAGRFPTPAQRFRPFACVINTLRSADIHAMVAFAKESSQLTKNDRLLMIN